MRPRHLEHTYSAPPGKFYPQLVHGSDRVRVFLLCLEPGQGLNARPDSEEMLCYVVEGRARLAIGREVFDVSAGDLAAAGPGEVRGIEAAERCVALWVHVPDERERNG